IMTVVTLGGETMKRRRKGELLGKVANSILEQVFDPLLEYKLTKKDVLDAFTANGLDRDKVTRDQINQLYVKIIHTLQVGELRDLTYKNNLQGYVKIKLKEIKWSRRDWEANGS